MNHTRRKAGGGNASKIPLTGLMAMQTPQAAVPSPLMLPLVPQRQTYPHWQLPAPPRLSLRATAGQWLPQSVLLAAMVSGAQGWSSAHTMTRRASTRAFHPMHAQRAPLTTVGSLPFSHLRHPREGGRKGTRRTWRSCWPRQTQHCRGSKKSSGSVSKMAA